MMLTHVEFRSDEFPPYDGEEEQINPGLWGRRLAEFLRDGLRIEGFQTEEPKAEDWGWVLPIVNDDFRLWVGCGRDFAAGATMSRCPSVLSSSGVSVSIFNRSRIGLSITSAKLLPCFVSLGIALGYQAINTLFEKLGNVNQLPPTMAAWSPDVVFGLVGLYFLLRMRS